MNLPRSLAVTLGTITVAATCFGGSATAASAGHKHFAQFQSPTGNIGCEMADSSDYGAARCDIKHHDWATPSRPKSCPYDYGNGLEVDEKGKGHYVCAGDTALDPSAPVLKYGDHIRVGRFRCTSRTDGMRCVNLDTQHGFLLSRQVAKRF